MLSRATPSQPSLRLDRRNASEAFTLVEVILAIGLATALLLIALVFYRQATDLREQIIRESEHFSALRLALDRLASDLRAAQPHASPGNEFTGDSNSLRFIKVALTSLPKVAMTNASPDNLASTNAPDPSDLVRVSFMTLTNADGTNIEISALDRTEEPLSFNSVSSIVPFSTNSLSTNSLLPLALDSTNFPLNQTNQFFEPFADGIRYVRFRYWDGTAWQPGWSNAAPPLGVEIVLAAQTLPDDAAPDTYPPEAFRRVVFLPGGMVQTNSDADFSTNNLPNSLTNAPPNRRTNSSSSSLAFQ